MTALLLLAAAPLGPVHADTAEAEAIHRDRRRAEGAVRAWKDTTFWPVRALTLLSLGPHWHPHAASVVTTALTDRSPILHAFAVETLRGTKTHVLRMVLDAELVAALVHRSARTRPKAPGRDHLVGAIHGVLARAFPEAGARTPADWQAWWKAEQEHYAPEAYVPRPPTKAGHDTVAAVQRALDLSAAGLEMTLCLDSTGSMQPTLDATRRSLEDLVAILHSLCPHFRVGLVQYRDRGDFLKPARRSPGARRIQKLTRSVDMAKQRLSRVRAGGGGDLPERVEDGLWHSYQGGMGWTRGANKLVVVVGDAPPHPEALATTAFMAEQAWRRPAVAMSGRFDPDKPVTGQRSRSVRPFITSCVVVGQGRPSSRARHAFEQIAEAGRGSVAELNVHRREGAHIQLVKQILTMSFGSAHQPMVDRFVRIWFAWRDAGYIPSR